MRVEDAGEDFFVVVSRSAFVMDNDIVSFRPVWIVIDGQGRIGGFVIRPDHIDLHVGAGLDPFGQDLVLIGVIVAATSGDEQRMERFFRCGEWDAEGGNKEKWETAHEHDFGGVVNAAPTPFFAKMRSDYRFARS